MGRSEYLPRGAPGQHHAPPSPHSGMLRLGPGEPRQEEDSWNLLLRAQLGPGRPRFQLASACRGSWGKGEGHNRMLSFYWEINENEWK